VIGALPASQAISGLAMTRALRWPALWLVFAGTFIALFTSVIGPS